MKRATSAPAWGFFALLLGASCSSPTESAESGEIRIRPLFDAATDTSRIGIAIDSIRLIARRDGEVVLDRSRRYTAGEGGYTWRVDLRSGSEELQVRVELSGAAGLLYLGERPVRVRSAGSELAEVMMSYAGPALVRRVTLSPKRVVMVREGATREIAGSAHGPNGEEMPPSRLTWSSSGEAVAAVTSSGIITGRGPGTAHVVASANGAADTVVVVVDTAVARWSTLARASESLPADGEAGTVVTVTLRHAGGSPVGSTAGPVVLTSTGGTLGPVTDHLNGVYTATLTAAATVGEAWVRGNIDGRPLADSARVRFIPAHPDRATSLLSAAPGMLTADGKSAAQVTVQLRDSAGNPFGRSAGALSLSTTLGTLGAVTDHQNGRYTATLTAGTLTGNAVVTGRLADLVLDATAAVRFQPGAPDTAHSTIRADSLSLPADGVSKTTVTVQLRDANGNALDRSGGTVTLAVIAGTLSPVVDHKDGTYTATLTAPTVAGSVVIIGMLEGRRIVDEFTLEFRPPGGG